MCDNELVTELVDLSGVPLSRLRAVGTGELTAQVQRVLRQVERPRANLGSSGPPGRAD